MRPIRSFLRFLIDDWGVASIYLLTLLPAILMMAGLGIDGVAALRTEEMLQSTADSAAIAAALRLPVGGQASPSQIENATAAALNYAQLNMPVSAFGNVLNTNAANNGDVAFGNWDGSTFTTPAPNGTAGNAVRVTVRTATVNGNAYPTSFLTLIGKAGWDVAASAVAMNGKPVPLCLLAFSAFSSNGGNSTDLTGCSVASNSDMSCTGHNLKANYGFAVGTNTGCGVKQLQRQPAVADPYANLASNIPKNICSSYPQEPSGKFTKWSGSKSVYDMSTPICGDLQLTGDVTVNTSGSGAVLVIENGQLDTNGHTLSTSNGSALTVIFSGTPSGTFTHAVTGNGTINFTGPSSGVWNQMAIYQDPILTGGVDLTASGNNAPTWNISGIVYLPHANLTIKGAINKSNNGLACFILVANKIDIRGTGDILAEGGCKIQPMALAPMSILVR